MSVNALQMAVVNLRPIPISLLVPITHLDPVLNYRPSGTPQLVDKFPPTTQVALTRCTRLRVTARSIQATHTRPTARASRCKQSLLLVSEESENTLTCLVEIDLEWLRRIASCAQSCPFPQWSCVRYPKRLVKSILGGGSGGNR